MKLFLKIEQYQARILFQEINNIQSFLAVKFKLLEYFKTCWHGNISRQRPYACIDTDLDRIYLVNSNEQKIISFIFGFNLKLKEEELKNEHNAIIRIGYKTNASEITEKMISECQSILSDFTQREGNVYWNLDMSSNLAEELPDEESIRLFEYVMMQEAGYIRYDDAVQDEKLPHHPRYHFDINYSRNAHYKIGLGEKITIEEMQFMFDPNTKCPFLQIKHNQFDKPPLLYFLKRKKSKHRKNN